MSRYKSAQEDVQRARSTYAPRKEASMPAAPKTKGGIPHMVLYLAVGAIVLLILYMVLKKRK